MSYTSSELNHALAEAERRGDLPMVANIKARIAATPATSADAPSPNKGKLPMMDAYLKRCIDRCRPKGGQ